MEIENKRTTCLWCERRLLPAWYQPPDDVNFGPVPRSREHIFPESLFGRIVTYDLCRSCNEEFGRVCDSSLVRDGRITDAAQAAGLPFQRIKRSFTMLRHTQSGKPVNTSYAGGEFRLNVQKFTDGTFVVPLVNGQMAERDFETGVQLLVNKVLAKKLSSLSDRKLVENLSRAFWEKIRREPGKNHHDPVLGESFRCDELPSKGLVQWQFHAWETDWSLAKLIFEFSSLLWPQDYLRYCAPVLKEIREFLEERHHDPVAGTGNGIFTFEKLATQPERRHSAECVLRPDGLTWFITLFGTARWKYQRAYSPGPAGAPSNSYRIRISNPFGSPDSPDASYFIDSEPSP